MILRHLRGRDSLRRVFSQWRRWPSLRSEFRPGLRPGLRLGRLGSRLVFFGLPFGWLVLFFLLPFGIILKISFAQALLAQPPYTPLFIFPPQGLPIPQIFLEAYGLIFESTIYLRALLNSVRIALITVCLTALIGYPLGWAIWRSSPSVRNWGLFLVILPFWTSFLIRVYAWIGILKPAGLLNSFLLWTGVISEPLYITESETAILIGLTYSYLPFMVLPVYAALERIDERLLEAAQDLGAPLWSSFRHVVLPLSLPGLIAGSLLVFIPAVGEFVIPDLLGGARDLMVGRVLWQEFFNNRDWPVASALTICLLVILVAPLVWLQRKLGDRDELRA